jgi:hypothetical protein
MPPHPSGTHQTRFSRGTWRTGSGWAPSLDPEGVGSGGLVATVGYGGVTFEGWGIEELSGDTLATGREAASPA